MKRSCKKYIHPSIHPLSTASPVKKYIQKQFIKLNCYELNDYSVPEGLNKNVFSEPKNSDKCIFISFRQSQSNATRTNQTIQLAAVFNVNQRWKFNHNTVCQPSCKSEKGNYSMCYQLPTASIQLTTPAVTIRLLLMPSDYNLHQSTFRSTVLFQIPESVRYC